MIKSFGSSAFLSKVAGVGFQIFDIIYSPAPVFFPSEVFIAEFADLDYDSSILMDRF